MIPRFSSHGPRDDQPLLDGDVVFTRLNMAAEPDLLAPGEYAFGRNVRVRRGKPTTRRGARLMAWGTAGTPNTTAVYASCSFRSPTGLSYILKARANHCEACDPVGGVNVIAYPGGVTLDSECELVQLFDRVLLLRGTAYAPLQWTPPSDWVTPFATAFTAISQTGTGGTDTIPNAAWAVLFKNRALVPQGRDGLIASDVLNYTRYAPITQQFRFNAGDSETLRGVIKAGRNSLLAFKESQIFSLDNFTGDLTAVTQDVLPIDVGLGARRTLVAYGQDILWMGPDLAIYTLQQALDNRLQGDERAFSDPIEPFMESIRPTLLHKCVARIWNKALYVAVPMGASATTANAILVYDFTGAGGWVSADTSGLYEIQNLLVHPFEGRQRLFMVHEDGRIFLLEDGYDDAGTAIPLEFISRGYSCGAEGRKKFRRGEVVLSTWTPTYTIQASASAGVL